MLQSAACPHTLPHNCGIMEQSETEQGVDILDVGAKTVSVTKIHNRRMIVTEESVVEELPLTVYLNGQELITILCSPGNEAELVLGFLVSEGIIAAATDIVSLAVDLDRNLAWAEATLASPASDRLYLKRCLTACCGKGRIGFYYAGDARIAAHTTDQKKISLTADEIIFCLAELDRMSTLFHATGGVHNGALTDGRQLLCFRQDIGRHNVFDRLYGYCLTHELATEDKALVFSGRVSSEIVLKVAKMGVSMIIARSAPTSLALELAEELGITVVGFARGDKMNLYTHPNRVIHQS